MLQVHRLTAAAICAGLGVNVQTWWERVLKEVHVKVILTLNGFLNTQLKYVGEVAGGIKPQINYGIANAESKQNKQCEFLLITSLTFTLRYSHLM